MPITNTLTKSFDLDFIESSPEIKSWINQFPKKDQILAKALLMNLEILPSDEFTKWLRQKIQMLSNENSTLAFYSIRKLDNNETLIWDSDGSEINRTVKALGSEDLVNATIANVCKAGKHLNHPSINELRQGKIRDIVLIDDSIGSGARVADYLTAMFKNKSILSWWSYGLINIYILAFSRSDESKDRITSHIPGTNHYKKKFKKNEKIHLVNQKIYSTDNTEKRWGKNHLEIKQLCESNPLIPSMFQLGFGGVMSNLIFSHSIPDNIPGLLWLAGKNWAPLFSDRVVPNWLVEFVQGQAPKRSSDDLSEEMLLFLDYTKKGIRDIHSISLRMNIDTFYARELRAKLLKSGLINNKNRITKAGADRYFDQKSVISVPNYDYSLYIPSSW